MTTQLDPLANPGISGKKANQILKTYTFTPNRIAQMCAKPIMANMSWARFAFCIKGLSPIMLDRMTGEQVLGLITGKKVSYPKDDPLEIMAMRKMYGRTYEKDMPTGGFGFPRENLLAALRDAGMSVQWGSGKFDKVTMSTKGTELFNMLRIEEPFFELFDFNGNPAEWGVDLRKGNATQGNGAVGIIRAKFNEWCCVGHVDLNVDSGLSEDTMKQLFSVAGIKQGLCSARPSKKMPFGQFALIELEWIDGADPKKSTARSVSVGAKPPAKRKSKKTVAAEEAAANANGNGDGADNNGDNGEGNEGESEE